MTHPKLLFLPLLFFIALSLTAYGQNQNISQGFIFDGEPYLSINPNDPQHMVVGWMGFSLGENIVIKTRSSTNGGRTWSPVVKTPHVQSSYTSADPSLAWNGQGEVFLCYIDFRPQRDSGAVYVRRSIDGGLNWQAPVKVIAVEDDPGKLPVDRPWMVVDRSGSANDGNIYVTSMTAEGATPPFHPYFTRSIDGGTSFEPWRYLDTASWLSGSFIQLPMPAPAVGPDEHFHAIYPSYVPSQNILPQLIHASSTDGGQSFNYNTVFASANNFNDPLAKKGHLLRANPANGDHLILFYLADSYGDADIFMRESMDGGLTWGNALRLNDDPTGNDRMQDLVWADFDDQGSLAVTWRDRRNASDSGYATETEIWGTYRHRDSSHFSPNFQLTDTQAAYDAVLSGSGNDFMCVQFAQDTLSAVWGDTRNGRLNIWFQRMVPTGEITYRERLSDEAPDVLIYPQPARDYLRMEANGIEEVRITTLDGKTMIQEQFDQAAYAELDLKSLSAGTYILHLKTAKYSITRKIIRIN